MVNVKDYEPADSASFQTEVGTGAGSSFIYLKDSTVNILMRAGGFGFGKEERANDILTDHT